MTRFSSVTAVLILAAITYASAGDDWAKELLKKENDNRAKHGSGKLQQSDELAKRAQKWADHLAEECKPLKELSHMKRDGNPEAQYKDGITGENIWTGQLLKGKKTVTTHFHYVRRRRSDDDSQFTLIKSMAPSAVDAWYGEIKNYPWDNKDYHGQGGLNVLHFTQEIWAETKEVGYGLGKKDGCDRFYVVARYYPTGNAGGAPNWQNNVKKAK